MRAAITSGSFADLHWPDFSDRKAEVQEFYELNANSLSWAKGMEPTGASSDRAVAPIRPEGASRRRLRRVQMERPAGQTQTCDPAAELTVCTMRYISDLHIGAVNPKRVAFVLDDASNVPYHALARGGQNPALAGC